MTFEHALAGLAIAGVLSVGVLGLCAHLCWLAVTDRGELGQVLGMLWEVVTG